MKGVVFVVGYTLMYSYGYYFEQEKHKHHVMRC